MVLESRILKYWPPSKLFIGGYRQKLRAPGTREETKKRNIYGVLARLASPDTQNRELASRLRNTCYRVDIFLGVIFYLSLHFSPVAEGNEESLRSGCMRRLHLPYVFFFLPLLLFF